MATALIPNLDFRDLEILPVRGPHPANEIEGQFRAGGKLRLLHLQQQPFRRICRQFLFGAVNMDALGIHRQGGKFQAPVFLLQIFHQLLAQIAHLSQIVQ